MHFRVRKNVIQFVRVTYSPAKKAGVHELVGKLPLSRPVLSDELRSLLTADELAQFDQWLNAQHYVAQLRDDLAALTLPEAMQASERWLERVGASPSAQRLANEVVVQWHSLRRTLVKQGLMS
jgi:hypothetical protein